MDLSRLIIHAQLIEADKVKEIERVRGNKRVRSEQQGYSQARFFGGICPQFQSRSLMPVPSSASTSTFRIKSEQGSRPSMTQSQDSVSNRPCISTCPKWGRDHPDECLVGQRGCFGCGKLGHNFRDCLYARQGSRDICPQSQTVSSLALIVRPTPPQGALSSTAGGQCQNCFYAIPPRQEQDDSPDVVTMNFEIYAKKIPKPLPVSTPVGEFVVAT
ncbi:uncharacterized protein LOC124892871 [Capsicum annuum]|uniref:uncharacterized protein LOC124892871 n=1 Tax=Capsicum annuum TaxID=4072 RepID=UPI001FB19CCF|nr:uncharacterized protein LOC124892871 [Capsicum annuum]